MSLRQGSKRKIIEVIDTDDDDDFVEVLVDTDDDDDFDESDADELADSQALAQARAKIKALKAKIAKRAAQRARKNRKTNGLTLIFSLPQSKLEKLDAIESPADKRLQQLLWELGCNFDLFPHQFKGVRALAGLSTDFPSHDMLLLDESSSDINSKTEARRAALKNAKPRRDSKDHGILLADKMGLGKTVQSTAAMVLQRAVRSAKGEPRKPDLIVSPSEDVLTQWKEHLLKAGLKEEKIVRFKTKQADPLNRDVSVYLCTRHNLQTEASHVFGWLPPHPHKNEKDGKVDKTAIPEVASSLFPYATLGLLWVLQNQYLNGKGGKNKYNESDYKEKLTNEVVVTRHLKKAWRAWSGNNTGVFNMVIIDEVHLLKNLRTLWAMAAGMIRLHSNRMVLLTGTPFVNSLQDMAALTTFIDPGDRAAELSWWEKATKPRAASQVAQKLANWTTLNVLRREKDVIAHLLPKKIITKETIDSDGAINETYLKYEKSIIQTLKRVFQLSGGEDKKGLHDALRMMLACASCMQLSLIHPILPDGGRQLSVLFSPSLCKNKTVKRDLEKPDKCVCCKRRVKLKGKKRPKVSVAAGLDEMEDEYEEIDTVEDYQDESSDDDEESNRDSDRNVFAFVTVEEGRHSNEERGYGNIVPIDSDMCRFGAEADIRHFACQSCILKMRSKGNTCPCCEKLLRHSQSSRSDVLEVERIAEEENASQISNEHVYCREVFGGFVPSKKLATILDNFRSKVPSEENVIIISFFKGSLDLLEAMFHAHKVGLARFDGDVKPKDRRAVLERFKTDPSCRVLLMTGATGGTGLNIVEANHVWFTERYWNPMVLEQCEDRAYRIGQKKDVDIVYHDVALTLDDVMRYLNVTKSDNAAIVLSDSVALQDTRMNFKETSGFLGKAISALRDARESNSNKLSESILGNLVGNMRNNKLPSYLATKKTHSLGNDIGSELGSGTVSDWACTTCTLVNNASSNVCEACNMNRFSFSGSGVEDAICIE